MRKIITQEEKDKKTKRNQLIIGIILIGVMIFGTLGYAFSSGKEKEENNKVEYKGIEFIKENDYWKFSLQGYNFVTKHNPKEAEDIYFLSYSNINNYVNKPLYLDSEFNEPNLEIIRNLNPFVLRIQNACLSDCKKDLPIKNCSADNVISIKEPKNESGRIYQEENCVFINANLENQTRYADAFLFKLLGI